MGNPKVFKLLFLADGCVTTTQLYPGWYGENCSGVPNLFAGSGTQSQWSFNNTMFDIHQMNLILRRYDPLYDP